MEELPFPLKCVHVFEDAGHEYVFAGGSLNIAEVSPGLANALRLATQYEWTEWQERLSSACGNAAVTDAVRSIATLRDAGFFAEPSAETISRQNRTRADAILRAAPQPSRIELLVAGTCNLTCTYCYADRSVRQRGPEVRVS